jgi:head-tail adaptor
MGAIGHLMTQTLSVYRPTETTDSGGGREDSFTLVATIRAKVNQPTPEEVQAAGVWGAQLSHVVHCEVYEDVRRADEFGGELPSEIEAGFRLRVIAVVSDSHQTYRRMLCEVVQSVDEIEDSS